MMRCTNCNAVLWPWSVHVRVVYMPDGYNETVCFNEKCLHKYVSCSEAEVELALMLESSWVASTDFDKLDKLKEWVA